MRPTNFIDHSGTKKGFVEVLEYIGNQKWDCLCTKCQKKFTKNSRLVKNLHNYSMCKECSLKVENWSPIKLNSAKNKGRRLTHNKKYSGTKNISGHQLAHIRSHAKSRNIKFSEEVTCEYLQKLLEDQKFKCALTGLSISHSPYNNDYYRKRRITVEHNTASLDRINSSKGYEVGNLHWVHKDVQKMKWNLSMSRFIELCNLIIDNNL